MQKEQKKQSRRLKLALLMAICILAAQPVATFASLDPDVIAQAKEAAAAAEAGEDYEPPATQMAQEEAVEEAEPEPARTTTVAEDPQTKYQPRLDQLASEKERLEAENKQLQRQIEATKSDKADEVEKKNQLDQQIYLTSSEINNLAEEIALLEQSIIEQEEYIVIKQQEIDDAYDLLKVRLRAMDVNDDATTLGLILGSGDFADFLTRTDTVNRIAEHDRELMQQLSDQKVEMEAQKVALEENAARLEADKIEVEEKKRTLSVQQQAVQATIYSLDQMEKEFAADLEKNKAKSAQMQREIEEIYRQIEWDKNPYVGGQLAWPVPGYYTVTSYYGWRFNGTDFHTGIDISGGGVYGKNIVAANDGTVKVANWAYTQGSGYGIYLLVDHGGGVSTLYGHASNLYVGVGDRVEKGQAIAAVGSTGWSTGPHLHFEYRVNGVHQNPYPLLTS